MTLPIPLGFELKQDECGANACVSLTVGSINHHNLRSWASVMIVISDKEVICLKLCLQSSTLTNTDSLRCIWHGSPCTTVATEAERRTPQDAACKSGKSKRS